MNFSFKDLIDLSKVPIIVFLLIAIVTGLLLFGGQDFLTKLELTEFKNDYGKFFGIVFIVCVAFVILSLINFIFKRLYQYFFYSRKKKKYITSELRTLDPHEQSVIREFIVQKRKTVAMPLDNPVVSGLRNKEILKIVSNITTGQDIAMSLTKIADSKLKHTDLGVSKEMTDDEKNEVFSQRPAWAEDYFYSNRNQ